jgi:autotransporter adhesin
LIDNAVKDKIDSSKQKIIDYGLSTATFKLQNQNSSNTLVSMTDTAIAGSDLDLADIRKQVAGKKSGDAKEIIGKYPSITNVDIHYSPFWVSSIPKNTSKINITVEKPTVKK